MIRQALGVNSGQFTIRIGDGDRTRCGEVLRRVAIALPTARSVGAASDMPQTGVDGNNRRHRFGEENGKSVTHWAGDPLGLPAGGRRATCFQGRFEGSGSPGKAEDA
jgi:hypothetical protein